MGGLLPAFHRLIDGASARLAARRFGRAAPALDVETIRGRIVKLADGDTVQVCDGRGRTYRVRLLSIDTPETHFQGRSQGYWGELAAARLAELLPIGSEVEVRTDALQCDVYGRVLGYVFLGKKFINRQMLAEGLAVTYIIHPNTKHAEEMAEVAKRAFVMDRGMYGDPRCEIPYEFRWRSRGGKCSVKLVGSLRGGEVLGVGDRERIALWDRVFFREAKDVEPPFYLSDRITRWIGGGAEAERLHGHEPERAPSPPSDEGL